MNFNPGDMMGKIPFGDQAGPMMSGGINAARGQIDTAINNAIDHLAGMVPGGEKFAPQAKQTVASALDTLVQQLQQQAQRNAGGQ